MLYKWLILLIAYLPFQIALNPLPGIDLSSLRVFILIFFLIWLWQKRKSFSRPLFFHYESFFLILFLLLAVFSLFFAENVLWGLRKILFFLSIFPLYFLTVDLLDNGRKRRQALWALWGGACLLAFVGWSQFLGQFLFGLERVASFWALNIIPVFSGFNLGSLILAYPSWLVEIKGVAIMRAFSVFSDPHIFSFYLGLIIPLGFFLSRKEKTRKWLFGGYWLLFVALLFSFARGAYLAVIVSFFAFSGLVIFLRLKQKQWLFIWLASLMIFLLPFNPFASRFYSSFDLEEGSNTGRLEMWKEAGTAGRSNFWQGVGFGNYTLVVDSDSDYRSPINAHNLYLDIFSEMGIFSLLVWLALFLGLILFLFKRICLRKDEVGSEELFLSVSLMGALVYFLGHSFFETSLYHPSLLALLMVILGLARSLLEDISRNNG